MKRSELISGLGAMAMLAVPLVCAPWYSADSLRFIRQAEQRTPAAWPSIDGAGALLSGETWAGVNRAVNDRMPFRGAMIGWKRDASVGVFGNRVLGTVGVGREGWLFFVPELGELAGTPEQVRAALAGAERFGSERPAGARLILVPSPDKSSLYADRLVGPLERKWEAGEPARRLVREWYRSGGMPERVDTWSLFERVQAATPTLLYEKTGSHHSSFGSMVLARAMVDAVDPTLWEDGAVTHTATLVYQSDLNGLAGYMGRTESWERFEVVRPGVELVRYIRDGEVAPGQDRPPPGQHAADMRPARFINRSAGAGLIPGRTLIVHDSFVASYLRPTLRQFYEDVTFIHSNDLRGPDFQEALGDFDLVYLQCVERSVRPLFSGYFARHALPGEHRARAIAERGMETSD
jgi:hypothetical protein